MAPFLSRGGYSSEALTFALGLYEHTSKEELQMQIVHHADDPNFGLINSFPPTMQQIMRELFQMNNFYPVENPPENTKVIIICHSEVGAWDPPLYHTLECPLSQDRFPFKIEREKLFVIGRTMFETDRYPEGWTERLNKMDEIWVPTKFHEKSFSKFGVNKKKLVVVPESVDLSFYNPEGERLLKFSESEKLKPFVFLSVFKLEERKGWDILLDAFFDTFKESDNVKLVILTNKYHQKNITIEEIMVNRIRKTHPEVYDEKTKSIKSLELLTELRHSDMPKLYRSADVFVLPTRGEGWGRPFSEAMASGIPCIATNWSGPTEYMDETNSYLLRIDGLVELPDTMAWKGHFWAEPSMNHLKDLLKFTFEHPNDVIRKGKNARKTMEEKYSKKKLSEIFMDNFRRILKKERQERYDEL